MLANLMYQKIWLPKKRTRLSGNNSRSIVIVQHSNTLRAKTTLMVNNETIKSILYL